MGGRLGRGAVHRDVRPRGGIRATSGTRGESRRCIPLTLALPVWHAHRSCVAAWRGAMSCGACAMTVLTNRCDPATVPHGDVAFPRWKRAMDVILSAFGLLAVLPLLFVIAVAVRATSPGPVFFVQTRVGRFGRPFRMFKFRTMVVDAEQHKAALLERSDRVGPCFKMTDDPRVTPIGRFLRRSSLDELPQILNVLLGDMSLVGPRPALPEEVAAYPGDAHARLVAMPGLTGPWQVSGRADVGFAEMVEMDVAYARGPTPGGDLAILWRTIGAVCAARGAC